MIVEGINPADCLTDHVSPCIADGSVIWRLSIKLSIYLPLPISCPEKRHSCETKEVLRYSIQYESYRIDSIIASLLATTLSL